MPTPLFVLFIKKKHTHAIHQRVQANPNDTLNELRSYI
jgi:hypothetical protein